MFQSAMKYFFQLLKNEEKKKREVQNKKYVQQFTLATRSCFIEAN